jgi:exopolysaccharide biosynthesis polyprenyl glycosylphosphotransferase
MIDFEGRRTSSTKTTASVDVTAKRRNFLTQREGKLLLAFGDIVGLSVPMILAVGARHVERPITISIGELATIAFAGLLWILFATVANIYNLGRASSMIWTQRATFCAVVVVLFAKSIYHIPGAPGIHLDENAYAVAAVGWIATWRIAFSLFAWAFPFTRQVLVIGAGVAGGIIAREVNEHAKYGQRPHELVGFVDDDPAKQNQIHAGSKVLGTSADILNLVEMYSADTICLAVNGASVLSADIFTALIGARERNIRIVSMPTMYENLTNKIAVEHVGSNWGIVFPVEHYRSPILHDVLVRIVDVVSGLIGLVICGAVIPGLALANRFLGSPGPLFYSQMRVGKGGKLFRIYKFRSMVTDAERAGAKWCTEDDPRITKVGNFIRRTRIDELPQFMNVLIGEMSLIGPRPERPEFVTLLSESIPFYRARHAVKPGLTGWAQVMYRYGASTEDSLIKLQYDLYYIKHRGPALDLRIFAKSFKTILTAAGR